MTTNTAEVLNDYPALSEMGITRFNEISHYTLRQEGPKRDVLRVVYKRAKGSLLPHSRKYYFGRANNMVVVDGGTATMETRYEISPILLKAIAELDSLVNEKHDSFSSAENGRLRSDMQNLLTELEQLVANEPLAQSAMQEKIDLMKAKLDQL